MQLTHDYGVALEIVRCRDFIRDERVDEAINHLVGVSVNGIVAFKRAIGLTCPTRKDVNWEV